MTGIDHTPEFMPYTKRKALRLVRESGGLVKFISQFLGDHETDIDKIRVCDPVVVMGPGQSAGAGLWSGAGVVCLGLNGHALLVQNCYIDGFWRVG